MVRTECSGPRMCEVQHFQGCSASAFVSIDVGIFVEPEGESAKSFYVALACHDALNVVLDAISLWSWESLVRLCGCYRLDYIDTRSMCT